MAKRTGENQDYYRHAGQAAGRQILARERRKVSQAHVEQSAGNGPPPPHGRSAKSTGAGVQTAERAHQKHVHREAEQVARDEVGRMIEAEVPRVPPTRQLPRATIGTALTEWRLSLEENARAAWRAGSELHCALRELARSSLKLARFLWAASG